MNLTLRTTLALGCTTLSLTACPETEVVPNEEHCVNQGGDAFCRALDPSAPFCSRGSCTPESATGCVAVQPSNTCYSPCGEVSVAEDPTFCPMDTGTTTGITTVADESAGPTTMGETLETSSTTVASTGGTSGSGTGTTEAEVSSGAELESGESEASGELTSSETSVASESSETGPTPCVSDDDCDSPAAPACDLSTGLCGLCSAAEDPDAACQSLGDPTRVVCEDDECVACAEADDRGCTNELPVCVENTCVACSEDDIGACDGQCLDNACVECLEAEDCESDPQRPVCDDEDNTCVACTAQDEGACGTADPENPICDPVARACVPCSATDPGSCDGATPICDLTGDDPVCVPCTAHADCSERSAAMEGSACDLELGSCLDPVFHVDGDHPSCNDAGNGTEAAPFCTLQSAVSEIAVDETGTIVVHPAASTYAPVDIANGRRIALVAAQGDTPRITGTQDNPNLDLSNAAVVYVDGLRFEGNANVSTPGIRVNSATLVLDRSVVSGNIGVGVSGTNGAEMTVRRSEIFGNGGDGLTIAGGALRLENSFVMGVDGVEITGGAQATVLYATVAGRAGEFDRAVRCTTGTNVTVRNSILLHDNDDGNTNPFSCFDAVISRSAFTGTFGGSNITESVDEIDDLDAAWADAWFENFENGDFHLLDGHPFEDIARWESGDPTTDLDGTLRPTTDEAPDVAGAHRLASP